MSDPTPGTGVAPPRFRKGDSVVLRTTMELGNVVEDPVLDGGEFWYRVRFVRRVENVVEQDLDPLTDEHLNLERLVKSGRWGTIQAFRCALTVERITHSNRSTVYSFNAQRILFEPYQYKPLLRVLDSFDRKLLIADEVGLGKTIEAGLILTELEARQELDRVIVACPSRLRDKWREELNRKFNQDFEVYTSQTLREYVTRLSQNPERGRLRGIISMQTLRNQDLCQLLDARVGYLDLVIVDEAHHGRNPSTQTADMLQDLARMGGAVLFLTATPLHLGTRDLFTLLNALRPADFRDPEVFRRMLHDHSGIHRARALVRSGNPTNLPTAATELEGIFGDDGRRTADPLAAHVIRDLTSDPPQDRRGWIELERRIDELHPLSTVLTRTRKRDVQQDVAVRRAAVLSCTWTDDEDRAYRQLVGGTGSLGWISERLSLGQIQRARQAASSIHAAILSVSGSGIQTDDDATEITDILPSEVEPMAQPENVVPGRALAVPACDSKFTRLLELLQAVWQEEADAKILIFTFFVGTAKYLADRLGRAGHRSLWIAGEVRSDPRDPERDERGRRMRRFREDSAIRVLVSTEVGSEGLDFQFCHHVVNYDLPWNPMVVEQRIGRIDRYGQRAKIVHIHNLVVAGTVEDRILHRLYERIGIFRESIGDLETILGETVRDLQREYLSGQLSPEEAEQKVEQAAQAIETRRMDAEGLEAVAGQLFGHEEFIRDEMQRVGRLGRHISGQAILAVLEAYLKACHPEVRIWPEHDQIYALSLTGSLEHEIRLACPSGQVWFRRARDRRFLFTTDGAIAFDHPEVELVNASHPLLRAAVAALKPRLDTPAALVGQTSLDIAADEDAEVVPGTYFVLVVAHEVMGIRSRRDLDPLVWSVERGRIIDAEAGERLLHLVTESGQEWAQAEPAPAMPGEVWSAIMSEGRRRNQAIRKRRTEENEASYERRRAIIHAEYEHTCTDIRGRLETARSRGRAEQVLALFEAQLAKAEDRYHQRIASLESGKQVQTRLSDPIGACVVKVRRRSVVTP
ncbi:MAG: DEAD/DEAH box helicase [Acidobacteria bacterium]|nr:DEAD/DEAH box helicase [Acidobacteriota bacterium]